MATWASLAVALIGLARTIIEWRRREGALLEAQDQLVTKVTLELLEITQEGQALRRKINSMSDTEAAELWDMMVSK